MSAKWALPLLLTGFMANAVDLSAQTTGPKANTTPSFASSKTTLKAWENNPNVKDFVDSAAKRGETITSMTSTGEQDGYRFHSVKQLAPGLNVEKDAEILSGPGGFNYTKLHFATNTGLQGNIVCQRGPDGTPNGTAMMGVTDFSGSGTPSLFQELNTYEDLDVLADETATADGIKTLSDDVRQFGHSDPFTCNDIHLKDGMPTRVKMAEQQNTVKSTTGFYPGSFKR